MRENKTGKKSNTKATKKSGKSKQKIVLIIAAVALAAVALTYFMIPDKINDIAGIDKGHQTVYLGETFSPEYVVKPGKFKDKTDEITFAMSDSNVASVNEKGEIQAFKLGETVLTMTVMNYVEEVTIEVVPTVTAINDVKNKVTLIEGDTKKLNPSITPAEDRFADEEITYKVANKNVATVNDKGIIIAKAPGTTKLTISAGGFEKTITIIVEKYVDNSKNVTYNKNKVNKTQKNDKTTTNENKQNENEGSKEKNPTKKEDGSAEGMQQGGWYTPTESNEDTTGENK